MATIHRAAKQGVLEDVVRLIQEDPGLVHSQDDIGCLPLTLAAAAGHMAIVTYLLDRGARPDDCGGHPGVTPLYLASLHDHLEMVKLLIARGADPGVGIVFGKTALMVASEAGRAEMVDLLLKPNVTMLDATNDVGVSAIGFASYSGHTEVVAALLKAGADPTVRDVEGQTPLHYARDAGEYECQALLEVRTTVVRVRGGRAS